MTGGAARDNSKEIQSVRQLEHGLRRPLGLDFILYGSWNMGLEETPGSGPFELNSRAGCNPNDQSQTVLFPR